MFIEFLTCSLGDASLDYPVTVRLFYIVWPKSPFPNPRSGCFWAWRVKKALSLSLCSFFFSEKHDKYFLSKYFAIFLILNLFRSEILLRRQQIHGFWKAWEGSNIESEDLQNQWNQFYVFQQYSEKISALISNPLQHNKYKTSPSLTAFTKCKTN